MSRSLLHLLAAACFALTVFAGLVGCGRDGRYRLLSILFEDVPPPGSDSSAEPVIRQPRRPPLATSTPTSTPAGTPSAQQTPTTFSTWDDVLRVFPKDAQGRPDWNAALDDKLIAPKAAITPGAVDEPSEVPDVELKPASDGAFSVVFSHQKHTQWLACESCHPRLFEPDSSVAIPAGEAHTRKYCGACHGRVAFEIVNGCTRCHLRGLPADSGGGVDWNRALAEKRIDPGTRGTAKPSVDRSFGQELEMVPPSQPNMRARFPHAEHERWLSCANCHPRPFPQRVGASHGEGQDLHSPRYCGSCHGTVSFGITGQCARCHPTIENTRHHQSSLDLDVEVASTTRPPSRTTFSHKVHTPYLECANCHTDVLVAPQGAKRVSVDELAQGEVCGACHGQLAFDLMARCQRCHPALGRKP